MKPQANKFARWVTSATCLVALLATLGSQWFALQIVAWGCMIVDFAGEQPLATAIAQTFDGQHPCRMCRAIQAGRQREQSEGGTAPWAQPNQAPELFCHTDRPVVPGPATPAREAVPFVPHLPPDFTEAPPTPPPRAA